MGEHFEKFTEKQQIKRARIVAIVLGMATIITLVFLVYAFKQAELADIANKKAIDCFEERIKLKEQLEQSEQRAAMERYRADHLQESLANQQKITEEMLKQRVKK